MASCRSRKLTHSLPAINGVDRYQHDGDAGPTTYTSTSSSDFIRPQIEYDWPSPVEGFALLYVTEPLSENLVIAGNGGYANLWFSSDAPLANVEVTLTEIYPDGTEVIVQSGLLNVNHWKGLDLPNSDMFQIEYTFSQDDYSLIIPGEYMEIKVLTPSTSD